MHPADIPDPNDDITMEDIKSPEFIEFVRQSEGLPVRPDEQDYDRTIMPVTEEQMVSEYQLATARKIKRLCRQWKATRP